MAKETLIGSIDYRGFSIEVHQDLHAEKQNDYCDMLSTFVHWHRRYAWDVDGSKEFGTTFDFLEQLINAGINKKGRTREENYHFHDLHRADQAQNQTTYRSEFVCFGQEHHDHLCPNR